LIAIALVAVAGVSLRGRAADGQALTVVKLAFDAAPDQKIDVWVTRTREGDGGLTIKLIAKGVGPRPQALTVYHGGGDDDGPGDEDVRGISAKVIDFPGVGKLVRIDFAYRLPGQDAEQTDTTLVGFGKKTHRVFDLTTRYAYARNPHCRANEETTLSGEPGDGAPRLVTGERILVRALRGDDDEPIDKSCRPSARPGHTVYQWNGEKFIPVENAASPEHPDGGAPDQGR
jgi:hypothetical protein